MQNRRGLSMPELMVAMTILFVVSTFIMSMFVTGMRQTAQATQNQDLENLTRKKLAELRTRPFASVVAESNQSFSPAPSDDRYRYSVAISPVPGEDPTRMSIVEVTVTHPEHGVRTARTVRSDVQPDDGQVAFEKFGCITCHSLPAVGTPPDPGVVPLGPMIPTSTADYTDRGLSSANPSEAEWAAYIENSIRDPDAVDAFAGSTEGSALAITIMQDFSVEGTDPAYDPDLGGMSAAEAQSIATWLAQFQP